MPSNSANWLPTITQSTTLDDLLTAFAVSEADPPEAVGVTTSGLSPAVERCCCAYNRAFTAAQAAGKSGWAVTRAAEKAFRESMPSLNGRDNIREFIACVAHGMLLNVILGPDGARLLYAAQIAHAAAAEPIPPRPTGRPRSLDVLLATRQKPAGTVLEATRPRSEP